MTLADIYDGDTEVYCHHCCEWTLASEWDETHFDTFACPECEAENGPLDGPPYTRSRGSVSMTEGTR